MQEFFKGRLVVETGDITRKEVDCIVNAANSSLMGGGGVDGAIHRAGGPAILEECKQIRATQYPNGLPTGKAVVTTGGNLPAGKIIHTVGPVWHGGDKNEDRLLEAAYRNSLDLAGSEVVKTIAFPAISTGVYGYPKDGAARVAFQAIRDYIRRNTVPQKIYLVFYSEDDERIFLESVKDLADQGN